MSEENNQDQQKPPYTVQDAIQVTDDLFQFYKEKEYHPGAFIHGLVFALEYAQRAFKIPQQQLADIKRDCKKYLDQLEQYQQQQKQQQTMQQQQ